MLPFNREEQNIPILTSFIDENGYGPVNVEDDELLVLRYTVKTVSLNDPNNNLPSGGSDCWENLEGSTLTANYQL